MKRPNILIVMTDHQRADTVLPDNPCIMPNVKKMATEGINFTKTYPPMAHCCPARATFMSGLYPTRTGVWNNVNNSYAINHGPHRDIRMWSQDLKDAGYNLSYCGKWHVSAYDDQTPKNYGWKELMPYSGNIQDTAEKWEKIREGANSSLPDNIREYVNAPGYALSRLYGMAEQSSIGDDKTTELALEELPKLAEQDKPWVLFVGYQAPHTPYIAEKKYLEMYDLEDTELPASFADTMEDKPDYYKKLRDNTFGRLDEDQVKEAIRHFRACCTKIDYNFGRILAKLAETGASEDTLVIFCADHGDYVGDHGLFHKQVPAFLGAYMVPAVVKWANGIKRPGRNVENFVSLADFAPTFLELAGVKADRYFSGDSLVPFLNNEKPSEWRDEMCTQCEGTEQMFTQRMVATDKYKYVYNGFGRDELYDLINDPDEMINIEDKSEYDEIKRDLVCRMWRFAYKEQDRLGSTQYIMVNTAPFGPMEAFRGEAGRKIPTSIPIMNHEGDEAP